MEPGPADDVGSFGLVTVIIPTYNRAHMVGRAIESVLRQSYVPIELIVIDDGSTDDTKAVVDDLTKSATLDVKYRWQQNAGCASARNAGLVLARGMYIAFLDSDDEWQDDTIRSLVSTLGGSNAQFVYSPAIEVLQDGTEITNYPVAAGRPLDLAKEHVGWTNIRNGAYLFHRSVLSRVEGFDERLKHNEDSDFVQRMAIHYVAAYTDQPSVRCYTHAGNKSRDRVATKRAVLQSLEKILGENPEFAAELGKTRAEKIRSDVHREIIMAFIQKGDWKTARLEASRTAPPLSIHVRAALWSGSNFPIRVWSWLRRHGPLPN